VAIILQAARIVDGVLDAVRAAVAVLGGTRIVRVHDVREMAQVVKVADTMLDAGGRITPES
jgi:dihydropteroate synthase